MIHLSTVELSTVLPAYKANSFFQSILTLQVIYHRGRTLLRVHVKYKYWPGKHLKDRIKP